MATDQRKTKALAALIDSNTLTEAAEKAGISRRTLYSYMRNDRDFAEAFKVAQERLTIEHIESLAADQQRARQAIMEIMTDSEQPGAIRLKAAMAILTESRAAAERVNQIAGANLSANTPFGF